MKINKRAISGPMMVLVLMIIILLLYLGFTRGWIDVLLRTSDRATCKASVDANAARFYEGFDFVASDIKCPPSDIKISTPETKDAFDRIANATFYCWYNFGEGKKSLFILGRGQEQTFCVICSYITFTGDAAGKQLKGYKHYLMTTPIPKLGDGRSFSEYIYGEKPTTKDVEDALASNDFIDTDKEYVMLFLYDKRKGYWDKLNTAGAAAIGGGVVAGVLSFFTFGTTGILYVIAAGVTVGGITGLSNGPDLNIDWTSGVVFAELNSPDIINRGCTRFGQ